MSLLCELLTVVTTLVSYHDLGNLAFTCYFVVLGFVLDDTAHPVWFVLQQRVWVEQDCLYFFNIRCVLNVLFDSVNNISDVCSKHKLRFSLTSNNAAFGNTDID